MIFSEIGEGHEQEQRKCDAVLGRDLFGEQVAHRHQAQYDGGEDQADRDLTARDVDVEGVLYSWSWRWNRSASTPSALKKKLHTTPNA